MSVETRGGPSLEPPPLPKRNLSQAMKRGAFCRCPRCGEGSLFDGYLKVRPTCATCGEEFFHHRADDAPPYFTILILGHILISLVLGVEAAFRPPMWVHMAMWIPFSTITALLLLRPIKGALVGLQWALYMHGFDPNSEDEYALMASEGRGSNDA
ncbi:DUF983 domain-containing protein [Breoghania sp.]|uniref:DUF983 domain-containing protein n=1 Tax=Breoghania sp. TaxID=2065378 RepID=UPI002617689E|nr:DUF983 domain-containing protein [Breoghania sp.]MDJ0929881.1 DUF983 domain-containing protein [Breoghania sp.]